MPTKKRREALPPVAAALGLAALLSGLGLTGCDGSDDRPATWSFISTAIIQPSCATASCHSSQARAGGLTLDDRENGYLFFLGPDGAGNYVVPGDAERSKLVYLLRGQETEPMPPDQPLPEADIELIVRWIEAGAEND